jgi:hypothetical protein
MVTAYAAQLDVEALIGDLVRNRRFTPVTIPSTTQVTSFLSITAATINVALSAAGYTSPIAVSDDPDAHEWVKNLNACGAATYVMGMMPATAWTEPFADGLAEGRRGFLEKIWSTGLKRIEQQAIAASGLTGKRNSIRSGAAQDSDGNTTLAIFSRSMMDYPGSRRLTE